MIAAKIPLKATVWHQRVASDLFVRVLATIFTALLHHNVVYLSAHIG